MLINTQECFKEWNSKLDYIILFIVLRDTISVEVEQLF